MTIETLTTFFMWCTIINAGMLIFATILILAIKNVAFAMHSRMFGISRDAFNVAVYGYLGVYKILIIVFNAVPWIVLAIMK